MKCISILPMIILSISLSFTQGYYPLKVGNTWTYRDSSHIGGAISWLTVVVLKDTMMSNGKSYASLSTDLFLRQQGDSVFSYRSSGETPLYYFSNKDIDTMWYQNNPIKLIYRTDSLYVLGTGRTAWGFSQLVGTVELIFSSEVIADSVGPVASHSFYGDSYLVSATIDGVHYGPVTSIGNTRNSLPGIFSLEQNYPNPFNPVTTISFTLPKDAFVSLKVYDLLGREVAILTSEQMTHGNHSIQWNANALASGIYLYCMQSDNILQTRKLVLLK